MEISFCELDDIASQDDPGFGGSYKAFVLIFAPEAFLLVITFDVDDGISAGPAGVSLVDTQYRQHGNVARFFIGIGGDSIGFFVENEALAQCSDNSGMRLVGKVEFDVAIEFFAGHAHFNDILDRRVVRDVARLGADCAE
ncbi:MAG: hypothetical protein FWH56_01300 [Betaproteobacteria bacterium]|nr:hypothetical protein [Betaproteobacteria bacterium]